MPSEFDIISRYFVRPTPQAVLGPGDDCALLAPSAGMELAITTDMLVEGTHFIKGTDAFELGWKTVAVNVSDLAAMGAKPRWLLLAGSLPDADENWIKAFSDGLFACAGRYGADLVGGDTTRGPLNLCVTALGEVPAGRALRREGARPGDDVWVSGEPGIAALGLAHLLGETILPAALAGRCISALQKPWPRVELGLALRERALASAAADVSDGLLADLGHIAERSRVKAEVAENRLPALSENVEAALARRCQIAGGDDYELVFTAPPGKREAIAQLAGELGLALTRIGRIVEGEGSVTLVDSTGQVLPVAYQGYKHFDQGPV